MRCAAGFVPGYRGYALRGPACVTGARRAELIPASAVPDGRPAAAPMPEGDTLARTAAGLRPHLVGRVVAAAAGSPSPDHGWSCWSGATVTAVDAAGKNLLIRFDNGLEVRTHLGMHGSWHRYRPGERWRRPPSRARLVIEVPGSVAVCFDAPAVELFEQRVEPVHPVSAISVPTSSGRARGRGRGRPPPARPARSGLPIADALLDQRAVAGIGNQIKNEILWQVRRSPWTPVGDLDDGTLHEIIDLGARILRRGAATGVRPRSVYRRAGRPCPRCGSVIRVERTTGDLPRLVFWCPACQELLRVPSGYAAGSPADRTHWEHPIVARPTRSLPLRWLVVLLPAAVVAVLELLTNVVVDQYLPFPWGTLVVVTVVLVVTAVFAAVAFARVDALTGALRAQNRELEARGASARALHRVSVAIAALSDVDDVLEAVVTNARELLAADVAGAAPGGCRRQARAERPPPAPRARSSSPSSGTTATRRPATGPWSSRIPPMPSSSSSNRAQAVVRLAAPLQRGGARRSACSRSGAATPRGFDVDEVETLASLANQAAIALEHAPARGAPARARGRRGAGADRPRAARRDRPGPRLRQHEVPGDRRLPGGRPRGRGAGTRSAELGAAARAVYVDVREAILGLRSPIEPGQGLGRRGRGLRASGSPRTRASRLDVAIPADGARPAPRRRRPRRRSTGSSRRR